MNINTKRLIITDLTMDMVSDIQKNSLDVDNRKFVPDEVFETIEQAKKVVQFLINSYKSPEGPYLYPIITVSTSANVETCTNENIGYVQVCTIDEGWEVGYHIAKKYTGKGYASEALQAFLPAIMSQCKVDRIYGVVLEENLASQKVLEKSGFKLVFKGIDQYQGEPRELRKYIFEKK